MDKDTATAVSNITMPTHNNFTGCLSVHHFNTTAAIAKLLAPMDNIYWTERGQVWWAFFYIMLIVFGILFLSIAVVCILLLVKRHLAQRFKVRTFIAIDISLITLGFSRVVFIIIDPWVQSGFCSAQQAGESGATLCSILSRYSGALAFPSLTASYTLVFITLWSSARIQLGQSSYQKYKVLIPLCFIHYIAAIIFETIGFIPWPGDAAPMVVMSLLIGCEVIFALWGFLVCFSYLFAGYRLLNSIEKSARNSSMICRDSPNLTRQQLIEQSKFQNQKSRARTTSNLKLKDMVKEHHRRAIRKVSIIMYLTVFLGMLYSALSLTTMVLIILTVFNGCAGFTFDMQPQSSEGWLVMRFLSFTLEFLLAVLLTYSIADYRPVLIFLRGLACGCSKLGKVSEKERKQSPDIGLSSNSMQTYDSPASPSLLKGGSPTPRTASPKHHVKFTFDGDFKCNGFSTSKEEEVNSKDDCKDEFNDDLPGLPPPSPTALHSNTSRLSNEYQPNVPSPLTKGQSASSNTSVKNDVP